MSNVNTKHQILLLASSQGPGRGKISYILVKTNREGFLPAKHGAVVMLDDLLGELYKNKRNKGNIPTNSQPTTMSALLT